MLELMLSTTAAIFSIVNPLGAIPLFLSLTADYTFKHRLQISIQTSLYTIGILLVFFWAGIYLLNFFGIDVNALRIAGGLIIFNSGMGLMSGNQAASRSVNKKVEQEAMTKEDISFTPMAMPMLAGPGTISYLINLYYGLTLTSEKMAVTAAIVLIGFICLGTLAFSPIVFKFLGRGGLRALSRIMGFLVMALGTQYVISGILNLVEALNH